MTGFASITTVALVLVGISGGEPLMADEAVSNQSVQREVDRLIEEINFLRKQAEQKTGRDTPDAVWVVSSSSDKPATDEDFTRIFNRLRREVADLAMALNKVKTVGAPATARRSRKVSVSDSTYTVRAGGLTRNREVTIRNVGEEVVRNPRLTVNGRKQWFTTGDILKEVLDDSMTDRDKAVAIWSFLKENRYHDQPAHNDIEIHDPVRYLNVYGYGFCDDSATNFMALAEAAGLKSRVWGLSGHVVPEAYYNGDWHMLDPDGEIYYLDDDGENISSIKTLEQRPDIIRKYPSPYYTDADMLVRIYTTTDDNKISEWYRDKSETVHEMNYVLRPGESISRSWDNWGLYFSSRYLREPRKYANGSFVYEPVLQDDLFRKGNRAQGLKLVSGDGESFLVSSSSKGGVWTIPVESPYPLLSGTVVAEGNIDSEGSVTIEFSEDGDSWLLMSRAEEKGPLQMEVPTRSYLRNGHGRPVYAYSIRISLKGSARIGSLKVVSEFQHAPHALPDLIQGSNRVHYSDETKDGREVLITFGFDEAKDDS